MKRSHDNNIDYERLFEIIKLLRNLVIEINKNIKEIEEYIS